MSIPFNQPHRILKEIFRHYIDFKDYVTYGGGSFSSPSAVESSQDRHIIEYGPITISFYDLRDSLMTLSPRKKEAMFYNVILDMKQREVAKIMGISPVSVGQYVEQACQQIAETYFAEMDWATLSEYIREDTTSLDTSDA